MDDEFYELHAPGIIRFFRGLVTEDVEELVQETFVRFLEARGRMRPGTTPRAYLYGIARNVFRERVHELVRERKVDPDAESMAALDPGPSTIAARRRYHRMLLEALRRLPLHHQEAVQLYYWSGLLIEEIAEIMKITPSGMRDRMRRAKELLMQQLVELEGTTPLIVGTSTPPDP